MTSLSDRAYVVDYLGKPQAVVEDADLLGWALEEKCSPGEAQVKALQEGIIPLRYLKNLWALNLEEQQRVCASTVLVCGCGGLGGGVIQLLARAGVGHLRLVDGDVFVPSNLNRQWFCDTPAISHPKAQVAVEKVKAINPLVAVDGRVEPITEHNVDALFDGIDLAMDALDNLPSRFVVAEAARRFQVPFVHAAVAGWWGQVSTFLPGSPRSLNDIYGSARRRDPVEESLGVPGAAVSVVASLEALEAIRILSGKAPAYADRLLYFDGERGWMEIIPF